MFSCIAASYTNCIRLKFSIRRIIFQPKAEKIYWTFRWTDRTFLCDWWSHVQWSIFIFKIIPKIPENSHYGDTRSWLLPLLYRDIFPGQSLFCKLRANCRKNLIKFPICNVYVYRNMRYSFWGRRYGDMRVYMWIWPLPWWNVEKNLTWRLVTNWSVTCFSGAQLRF